MPDLTWYADATGLSGDDRSAAWESVREVRLDVNRLEVMLAGWSI